MIRLNGVRLTQTAIPPLEQQNPWKSLKSHAAMADVASRFGGAITKSLGAAYLTHARSHERRFTEAVYRNRGRKS
jgi:hypothetical protein